MNRRSVRFAVASLTFTVGLFCVAVLHDALPNRSGRAASALALVGSALCFALAYAGEEARRRRSDAAIAVVLPMLCAGLALLAAGVWLLVEALFLV